MIARITGVHVLLGLIAFFGAVIAVDVGFSVMAVRTFPGEEVTQPYVQGLHYNDTLRERAAQAALGWRAGAELSEEHGQIAVLVRVVDAHGAPPPALRITGSLMRPTEARFDHVLAFHARAGGAFVARVNALEPGQWRLQARVQDASGGALDFERSFEWRSR